MKQGLAAKTRAFDIHYTSAVNFLRIRFLQWIYSRIDLIATILLMLGADDFWFMFSGRPVGLPGLSFLDHSWMLDLGFKARQGIWLGKDVAFSYGPLSQWLRSFPSAITGFSLGSSFKTSDLLPHWSIFLLTWGTSHLLLFGLQ